VDARDDRSRQPSSPDTATTVFVMAFLAVGIRWKSLSAGGFEEVESHGI
jgi:hypothetical protein